MFPHSNIIVVLSCHSPLIHQRWETIIINPSLLGKYWKMIKTYFQVFSFSNCFLSKLNFVFSVVGTECWGNCHIHFLHKLPVLMSQSARVPVSSSRVPSELSSLWSPAPVPPSSVLLGSPNMTEPQPHHNIQNTASRHECVVSIHIVLLMFDDRRVLSWLTW